MYYTAQVGKAVELVRVPFAGSVEQLTHNWLGIAHYHPKVAPDGRLMVFGSTHDDAGAQYVADAGSGNIQPITTRTPGRMPMHAHWRPLVR